MGIDRDFRIYKMQAEEYARRQAYDSCLRLAGTARRKAGIRNRIDKYIKDTNHDYLVGFINSDEYCLHMRAAKILQRSLELYIQY